MPRERTMEEAVEEMVLDLNLSPMGDHLEARRILEKKWGRSVSDPEVSLLLRQRTPDLDERERKDIERCLDMYRMGLTPLRDQPQDKQITFYVEELNGDLAKGWLNEELANTAP